MEPLEQVTLIWSGFETRRETDQLTEGRGSGGGTC